MEDVVKLVIESINGNKKSFEELCEVKAKKIVYLCIKNLRDLEMGEDAAQEVFISMQKNIHKLKDPQAFDKWTYTIIGNICNNMRRTEMKKNSYLPIEEYSNTLPEKNMDYIPQEFLENTEKREELLEVINNMRYNMRMSVILFYYDGLSQADIAEVLNISVNTVNSTLQRARIKIREKVEMMQPQVKAGNKSMPMILLSVLFEQDSNNIVTDSVIQKCLQTAALSGTGILTTAAGVSGKVIFTKIAAFCLLATGCFFTAHIVTANGQVASNPSLGAEVPSIPQYSEKSDQSKDEDIARASEPSQGDSSALEEFAPKSTKNSDDSVRSSVPEQEADGAEMGDFTITGKVEICNKNGVAIEKNNPYVEKISVQLLYDGKPIQQTFTDQLGKFSFVNSRLEKGDYELQYTMTNYQGLEFSTGKTKVKQTITLANSGEVEAPTILIKDEKKTTVSILFYGQDNKSTRVNPYKADVLVGDETETSITLSIVDKNNGSNCISGSVEEINAYLQGTMDAGEYILEATVVDFVGNTTSEELDFYIV